MLHEGEEVIERDSSWSSENSERVSQSLSLVEEQLTKLFLLLRREVTDHNGEQLGVCVCVCVCGGGGGGGGGGGK